MPSPEEETFKVTGFLDQARRLLEASYPVVWIQGEISSLRKPSSGHIYFALKDEKSQVRCAFFRNAQSLRGYQPIDGDLVRIRARVTIYSARGDLQLIVQHIEEAGEGVLLRRFEELKKKLAAEGLFDSDLKKDLPRFPNTLGIISSSDGAALHDIITTLGRRFPGIRVLIYPSLVQGDTAPDMLRTALADAVRHGQADVLVITRGGGSLEDLWAFNNESLARDIAACPIPIVSAVGHEIDFTISDFVADQRAPTPTAAAEIISPDREALSQSLRHRTQQLIGAANRKIQLLAQTTDGLQRRLLHPSARIETDRERLATLFSRQVLSVQYILARHSSLMSEIRTRISASRPSIQVQTGRDRTTFLGRRLQRTASTGLELLKTHYATMATHLDTVSPLATMARGYSMSTIPESGEVVRTILQRADGDSLDIRVIDGTFHCRVEGSTKTPS